MHGHVDFEKFAVYIPLAVDSNARIVEYRIVEFYKFERDGVSFESGFRGVFIKWDSYVLTVRCIHDKSEAKLRKIIL